MACGDFHHDTLAFRHEERSDEHKEYVVEEEGGEEDCANFQAGKTKNLGKIQ